MERRYIVLFGACLTQFTIIGLLFSYGLFFKVFEDEYGWSRTLLSACSALAFFMMGALAIVGGRLNDRFGPRPVLATTGLLYGIGFALISQVTEPWQLFLIFGTFIGLGMSTHDVVTLSTIARWFDRRRGMMSGVVKVGTAVGQMALPPLAAILILALGWRMALVALGLGGALLLLIAAFAMARPAGGGVAAAAAGPAEGATYGAARRTRTFWTLCAIQFLFFPSLMTIPLHIAVHGMDMGMAPPLAAGLLSVIGGASVAGRLLVGALADRIGGRLAFVFCFTPLIAGLLAFPGVAPGPALYGAVAVYGFAHGGLFTIVSPTVASYFGMRAHGAIFGTVLFFGTIGGSIGPIAAGWIHDATGDYLLAFRGLAVLAATGLALALSLPRPADRPLQDAA